MFWKSRLFRAFSSQLSNYNFLKSQNHDSRKQIVVIFRIFKSWVFMDWQSILCLAFWNQLPNYHTFEKLKSKHQAKIHWYFSKSQIMIFRIYKSMLLLAFWNMYRFIISRKIKIETTSKNSLLFFNDSNDGFLCFENPYD